MMRHIVLFLLTMVAFAAKAELAEPDFAYPKRTMAQADSLMRVATKQKNGTDQLLALCIKTRSYAEIDRDKLAPMVDTLLIYSNKQKNKTVASLMRLYAATIAYEVYSKNSYAYNSRDIPDTQRPADMKEWSGAMFVNFIDSLATNAWQDIADDNAKMRDYSKVITQEEIAYNYYPLVRDFVALKAMGIMLKNPAQKDAIYNQWLNLQPKLSKQYFAAWLKGNRDTKDIYDLYIANANNDNAQILISQLNNPAEILKFTGMSPVELIEFYTKAKKRASGTWLESYPLNAIYSIKCPQLSLKSDDTVMTPGSVDITATYKALQGFTLKIYKGDKLSLSPKELQSKSPIDQPYYYLRNYQYTAQDTTLRLDLQDGIYYVMADYPVAGEYHKPDNFQYISFMVTRYLPVISQYNNNLRVVVVDAVNACTAPNIYVTLTVDKKKISRRSDKNGIVTFEKLSAKPTDLYVNGLPFDIDKYYVDKKKETVENQSIVCNTDLGVYHPGDTVNCMVIKTVGKNVDPQAEVDLVLYNADGEEVASAKLVTDEFGRASTSFNLPTEGKTGQFCLAASSGRAKNYKLFMVSDFKVDDYRFEGVEFWPNTPKDGELTVKGRIVTYTGQSVGNADVNVLVDDKINATSTTGVDGAFSVTMPMPTNDVELGYARGTATAKAQITATLLSGQTIDNTSYFSYPYAYHFEVKANDLLSDKFENTKPLSFEAKIVGPDDKAIEVALKWNVRQLDDNLPVAAGASNTPAFTCDLTGLKAGRYKITIATADSTLAMPYERNITLYNTKKDEMPGGKSQLLWIENTQLTIDKYGKASCTYYLDAPEAMVFFFDNEATRPENILRNERIKGGWHTLVYSKPGKYVLYAINGNRTQDITITVSSPKSDDLKIITESIRDHFDCGVTEKWSFKVVDAKNKGVKAAMVLDVYNQKLDALYNNNLYRPSFISPVKAPNNLLITQSLYGRNRLYSNASVNYLPTMSLIDPEWIYNPYERVMVLRGRNMMRSAGVASTSDIAYKSGSKEVVEMAMVEQSPVANFAADEAVLDDGAHSALEDVKARDEVFLALWRPDLVTDNNGKIELPFAVPDAITKWQLQGVAWTADGRSARIGKEFTTDKVVTVNLNAPRFVRHGDRVRLAATVRNNTDNALDIKAMFNVGDNDSIYTVSTAAHGTQEIFYWANIGDGDTLNIAVRAAAGNFTDGERVSIPVLASQFNVTESQNFYLNPGQSEFSLPIPPAKGSDWHYAVDFTENPMSLIVSALPDLQSDRMCETAIAQAAAFYSSAVAMHLIKQHPDSDWPMSLDQATSSMQRADKMLCQLYDKNGGWLWGGWSREPSPAVTRIVLSMLAIVKDDCSKDLSEKIANALVWIDDKVSDPDIDFAVMRAMYPDFAKSLNAKTTIEKTMQAIIGAWKSYPLPLRAEAAQALWLNDYINVARELVNSIDEYLTVTPDRGSYFANYTDIGYYPTFLTTYADVRPASTAVDGLRQYLLMRKQGQNWGQWPITSSVIQAVVNNGTLWVEADASAIISTDNKTLSIKRKATTPAFGALTVNYLADVDSIQAYSDGEIAVTRNIYVIKEGKATYADTLRVGDRVRVSMLVKASRAMSNVTLSDQRPAAFSPVEQMPGYVYTDRTWAYRENRDAVSNFYIDYLPQGVSMFEYECFVTLPGRFAMGTAVVTNDLAPTLTAHSSASKITINAKR